MFFVWIWMAFRFLREGSGLVAPTDGDLHQARDSDNSNTDRKNDDNNNNNSNNNNNNNNNSNNNNANGCSAPFSILNDLTEEQRNPTVGRRWMVRPPTGGNLHLLCCETTKGPFRVLLHERWAPIGVPHLLEMMEGGYFEEEIPLFRCTDACQFGLSANRTLTKQFDRKSIPDDPLWLPTGPEHRFSSGREPDRNNNSKNISIKRYPKGVLTHAGSGKNSRGVQFVLTLKPNKYMGGGSPWEVPLGEIVEAANDGGGSGGDGSADWVDVSVPDFYTGYGEKGPGQGLLGREGVTSSVREQWPLLDYVQRCSIVDQYLDDGHTD